MLRKFFIALIVCIIGLTEVLVAQQKKVYQPADSFKFVLDTLVNIFKTYSLNGHNIDKHVVQKTYKLARHAQNIGDLRASILYLFKTVKDDHGWFQYDTLKIKWSDPKNLKPVLTTSIKEAFEQPNRISAQSIADSVGYIRIRFIRFNLENLNKDIETIKKAICSLDVSRLKAFIIDLRLNTGGSMYPMIAGLSNILGEGIIGGHYSNKDRLRVFYRLKDDNLIVPNELTTDISFRCTHKLDSIPVVVLIGPFTASAGERTAIAFKGRAKTIFIGEQSARQSTTTKGFYFQKNCGVVLATDVMIDRNGITYENGISPDILINQGDDFIDLMKDLKISAALGWIFNQRK